jgi:hypothetical protein
MSTVVTVTDGDRERFYAAALAGLRALDAREPNARRFGREADGRWASFAGALTDADRIDFLLRDAAVTWGVAFSPAEAFGLFGLAPDEPFGPDWRPLSPKVARRYLDAPGQATTPSEVGALLGVATTPVPLLPLTPSTRVAVAGGAALVSLAEAFAAQRELSWSDQVLVLATAAAHRQLAGLLAVVLGASSRTRLARPEADVRATLKAARFAQVDVAIVSPDAEPECADFARRAAGVV